MPGGVISTTANSVSMQHYKPTARIRAHEIKNPIRRRPQRRTFRPHREGIDLSRIQPRHALPPDAKEDIVQEKEGD